MGSDDRWLTRLSDEDLLGMIPNEALEDLETPDKAASLIIGNLTTSAERRRRLTSKPGEEVENKPTISQQSWQQLKREFHSFICTDAPAYAELRAKLNASATALTVISVAMISQALGDKLGLLSGPLVSLVALLLYTVVRLGKGTFCGVFGGSART